MDNYYEILHIANFAEIEVVRAAYKAMIKLYHPDSNKNVDSKYVVKLNLAYEVLGDSLKKKDYDYKLKQYLNENERTQKTKGNTYKSEKGEAQNEEKDTYQNKERDNRGDNSEEENNNKTENASECSEEADSKEKNIGKVTKGIIRTLGFIAHSFIDSVNEMQKEYEDAYLMGKNWDDEYLIQRYLRSKGFKRNGYLQVLKERGLLCVEDGKIIVSDRFRMLSRK